MTQIPDPDNSHRYDHHRCYFEEIDISDPTPEHLVLVTEQCIDCGRTRTHLEHTL